MSAGNDWQFPLFGCFSNCYTCVYTYFCPCVVAGRVAEAMGEPCFKYGCLTLVPIAGILCRAKIREMIRGQRNIPGTSCNDIVLHWFCGCCALIQEARELQVCNKSMAEHPAQEMARQ